MFKKLVRMSQIARLNDGMIVKMREEVKLPSSINTMTCDASSKTTLQCTGTVCERLVYQLDPHLHMVTCKVA